MICPSCTSTAPTGTSPNAAPCAASARASRMKRSSWLRSMICGFLTALLLPVSYHLDRCHQPGFHVVDDMTVKHPDTRIISDQRDTGRLVLAQQVGIGEPRIDLAAIGRDHLEGDRKSTRLNSSH